MWRTSCSTTSGRRRPACAEEGARTGGSGGCLPHPPLPGAPGEDGPSSGRSGLENVEAAIHGPGGYALANQREVAETPGQRSARLVGAVVTAVTVRYLNSQQPRLVTSNVRLARTQRGERLPRRNPRDHERHPGGGG